VYAKIKTVGVLLEPVDPGTTSPKELYRDQTDEELVSKTSGGVQQPVTGSASSVMTKVKQNTSGVTIPVGVPVGLKPDGGIVRADSDGPGGAQIVIGISLEEILDTEQGTISLIGPNAVGS